ncbi:MAG: DUF86 domain-containing protein [Nitrospira sp.]|nr:DUF86 domain-containing protein [bacterium]MBL7050239.1 DUF86 domain-containing protein [Nitrospira sp.]
MVDKNITGRKLADIDTYLKQLSEFTTITVEQYKQDWKTQRIVERTLQMLIETCIDIANHIVSDDKLRVPESYSDTFKVLMENKFITESLSEKMIKAAKFRNVVVHQYDNIDAAIAVSIVKNDLMYFREFQEQIVEYLK